jgi:hypothetical protein
MLSSSGVFSAGSEDSYSDGEVLPMSTPVRDPQSPAGGEGASGGRLSGPAGEWTFTALDERYLLPLFSNSVASRSFNARKAGRRAALGLPPDGASSRAESPEEEGRDDDGRRARKDDFAGSVGNFFGVLRGDGGGAGSGRGSGGARSPPPESPGLRDVGKGSASR